MPLFETKKQKEERLKKEADAEIKRKLLDILIAVIKAMLK